MSKKSSPKNQKLQTPWDRAIERVAQEAKKGAIRPNISDPLFIKQAQFLQAPAKRKALHCTRRAAKSYTGGLGLVDAALSLPECNVLYLGLTRASAKGVIWKDILKQIDRKHDLGMGFNGSELTATLPNGSMIYATGVDADEDEMHKLLGKKWFRVVIDESQSYGIDLRALVYGILGPAMVDLGGDIWLLGTSGNLTTGLFYDITTGKEPGWELFQWTAHDNPYVAKKWQEELDDIDRTRPLFKQTALYRQWYLNEWVIDDDARVYKYGERNRAPALPAQVTPWRYVLGLDLAHSPDSTAFVVGAYHECDPSLYLVHAHKETKLDITAVAEKVRALESIYPFEVRVVDGANKQAVAELNNRHSLNLIPADKTGKVDFITIMNDDFIQGKVKLLPQTSALSEEYKRLIWMTDANGKVIEPKKENPLIHNDLSDAALYLWRYCYQYLFQAPQKSEDPNDQAVWERKHIEKLQQEVRQKLNPNELDLNWMEEFQEDPEFSPE